jgi:hypothetical protein
MEVSGEFHSPAALHQGKQPQVPIGYEAGWAPEPVFTLIDILPLPGIELQPVSPSLYRLSYLVAITSYFNCFYTYIELACCLGKHSIKATELNYVELFRISLI